MTAPALDDALLGVDEPEAVRVSGGRGLSPFFVVCDHAGNRIPRALGTLGLSREARESHRAWDIGAEGVARRLGTELGAMVVGQRYSRLVIDCNRPLTAPDSLATLSEGTAIPGNVGLSPQAIAARVDAVFRPYHERIAAELDARVAMGRASVLVALHSFTPIFEGVRRPWHVGVLFDREARLGEAVLALLRAETGLMVGCNEPYAANRAFDYSLMHHGEDRGLLCVELEIRQDLLADKEGQCLWGDRLARVLRRAVASLSL